MTRLFGALLWAATALALSFLLLPIASIFLRIPPSELLSALGSDVARDALVVTFETTLVAQAAILLVGTPAAYLIASRRFVGRAVIAYHAPLSDRTAVIDLRANVGARPWDRDAVDHRIVE